MREVNMPGLRIAHLTTVHPRYDTRIFHKECASLARRWETRLFVADGKGEETRLGVVIHDTGRKPANRLLRMLLTPWRTYRSARALRADVYHFHDPELIPVGLLLHWRGATVIYDVHEDVPRDILSKPWLPSWSRGIVSRVFECLENFAARRFSAVVAATPYITERFCSIGAKAVNVNNYPILDELAAPLERAREARTICYVGGITVLRGAREMVAALPEARATLLLAGPFESAAFESELRAMPGWQQVRYFGVADRISARDIMTRSLLGVVLLHPAPNHMDALPTKMFEYMSAGIAVLASDFPLWRGIVEDSDAGLCVDPLDSVAIARTLSALLDDPARLEAMGQAGRRAVVERYSWENEEQTLLALYEENSAAALKKSYNSSSFATGDSNMVKRSKVLKILSILTCIIIAVCVLNGKQIDDKLRQISRPYNTAKLACWKIHCRLAGRNYETVDEYSSTGKYFTWKKGLFPILDSKDENGVLIRDSIPMFNYSISNFNGRSYHPVGIAQYGLNMFGNYVDSQNPIYLKEALNQGEYFVNSIDKESGLWFYDFDFKVPMTNETLKAPWASALAQMQACSLLVRLYHVTGDVKYYDTCKLAMKSLQIDVKNGGLKRDFLGHDFYEEYPTDKPNYVINGFMFVLIGLHDVWMVTNDETAHQLYQEGFKTLLYTLPFYDADRVSLYHLGHHYDNNFPPFSHCWYHKVHIGLMRVINQWERNHILDFFILLWVSYEN